MSGINAHPKSAQKTKQGCGSGREFCPGVGPEGDPELLPGGIAPALQTDTGSNPPNPKYGNWSNTTLFLRYQGLNSFSKV